jgi:hypothetical protein
MGMYCILDHITGQVDATVESSGPVAALFVHNAERGPGLDPDRYEAWPAKRYLTAYVAETGRLYAYLESEVADLKSHPRSWASDWVWQYAPGRYVAMRQHNDKVDEREIDPTKETY